MTPEAAASDAAVTWVELVIRAWPVDVDLVADVLRDISPAGVSIEPAIRTLDHDNFQYELLDAPTTLRVCLAGPISEAARRALRRRLVALPLSEPLPPLRYRDVSGTNWAEEWKRFFSVLHIGERLVVRPSWEDYEPRPEDVVIDLDPGTAFGTGQHETTRLCLAAVETYTTPGATVLDVGSGSGILAIAAAKLGASAVYACDTDANAVAAADANFERNEVTSVVHSATGTMGAAWPWPHAPEASADLVVANISSVALIALMPDMAAAVRPGGHFIGSGFIDTGRNAVETATVAAGLRTIALYEDAEWRCLVAERPERA